jgi:ATP-binding cassette, subfamily G (WHITE), eye pigment precursor transporter
VLVELQLEKCEFTMIGGTDPVFVKKGLSGGERKRLAIATELLLTPTVIFLDEPTSGLDSVMAEALIMTLSDLTAKGRIVIASIHSPSSEMIKLFTHTVLLTCKGRLAFHGRIPDALTHFATLGYKLPEAYNPSDFFLQLLSFRPHLKDDNDQKRIDSLVTEFKASSFYDKKPLEPDQKHQEFRFVQGLKVSSWTLFKLNIWRGALQTQRWA